MKRSQAFPSQWLSKEDVQVPIMLAIKSVTFATVQDNGRDTDKPTMNFIGNHKPLLLNNTNWMVIEAAFGEESDHWIGKTVEAYFDPNVMFGKDRVGGVRLRIPVAARTITEESLDGMGPVQWSLAQAVAAAEQAGIPKADFMNTLKATGAKTWNPVVQTAWAMKLIEDHAKAQPTGPLPEDDGVSKEPEEPLPF